MSLSKEEVRKMLDDQGTNIGCSVMFIFMICLAGIVWLFWLTEGLDKRIKTLENPPAAKAQDK